jgi:hypothetical protein
MRAMDGSSPRYWDTSRIPAGRLDVQRVVDVVREIQAELQGRVAGETPTAAVPRGGVFGREWPHLSQREQNLGRILLSPDIGGSWLRALEPLRVLRRGKFFRRLLGSLGRAQKSAATLLLFRAGMLAQIRGQSPSVAMRELARRLQAEGPSRALRDLAPPDRNGYRTFIAYGEKILGRRRPFSSRALRENALAFPFDPVTGEGVGLGARRIRRILDGASRPREPPRKIQRRLARTKSLRPARKR